MRENYTQKPIRKKVLLEHVYCYNIKNTWRDQSVIIFVCKITIPDLLFTESWRYRDKKFTRQTSFEWHINGKFYFDWLGRNIWNYIHGQKKKKKKYLDIIFVNLSTLNCLSSQTKIWFHVYRNTKR